MVEPDEHDDDGPGRQHAADGTAEPQEHDDDECGRQLVASGSAEQVPPAVNPSDEENWDWVGTSEDPFMRIYVTLYQQEEETRMQVQLRLEAERARDVRQSTRWNDVDNGLGDQLVADGTSRTVSREPSESEEGY